MKDHYAALIWELPSGYAASLEFGMPQDYLQRSVDYFLTNGALLVECVRHARYYQFNLRIPNLMHETGSNTATLLELPESFTTLPKAKAKCLEILLDKSRIRDNQQFWIKHLQKDEWEELRL